MARRKAERMPVVAQPMAAEVSQNYEALVTAIAQAHNRAQRQAVQAINVALTLRNWLIGYHIVEYEQHGRDRAQYGERLLDNLTNALRKRLGRGFGRRDPICRTRPDCLLRMLCRISQQGRNSARRPQIHRPGF